MKVTQGTPTFKPVVITLETPEEVAHFENITGYGGTAARAVAEVSRNTDAVDSEALRDFLTGLYRKLQGLNS